MSTMVYVIDDEPAIRQIFTIALERARFKVHTFPSGGQFVRQAPAEPDIMVLDLIMPGLNGDEVARICRRDWGWNRVRICVITGSLMLARGSLTDVDEVLEKPVSIDQLVTTVQRLAEQQPPADAPPSGVPPQLDPPLQYAAEASPPPGPESARSNA